MDRFSVFDDWFNMIKKSWTWAKLTTDEKNRFRDGLQIDDITGTYQQRWKILNNCYRCFLYGLGYEPTNWRDEKEEVSN